MPRPSEADALIAELAVGRVVELEADAALLATADTIVARDLGATAPLAIAERVAPLVREGARLVLVAPTTREGWSGARVQILGMLRRRVPRSFEELCEALLIAGFTDVQARELRGGVSVAWGSFTPPAGSRPSSARSASPPSAG